MPCIFCDNNNHDSHECPQFATMEARKAAPNANRFCFSCHMPSAAPHLPGKKCGVRESCKDWYSTEHHTIFCEERVATFQLFRPKIDKDLMPRFLAMFEIDEKYSLALSSPEALKSSKLIPIRIIKKFGGEPLKHLKNSVIVFNNKLFPCNISTKIVLEAIASKKIINQSKNLKIKNCQFSFEEFKLLLSPYNKKINIYESKFTETVAFADILKLVPNIESFSMYAWKGVNVEYGEAWLDDLLKYKNGKNFDRLSITVKAIEFDPEKMVKFITTKCTPTVSFSITYPQNLEDEIPNAWNLFGAFEKKMLKYFEDCYGSKYCDKVDGKLPQMRIGFDGVDGYIDLCYAKRRIMPSRAATKRNYRDV